MKAAYVKAPFHFELREVELGTLGDEEILVDVRACGVRRRDLELARRDAVDWLPVGHDVAGVVAAVGRKVAGIRSGDKVVLESSCFERSGAPGRGRRPPSQSRAGALAGDPKGFAERMVAPPETAVPFEGISFTAAAMLGPLSAAVDLVTVADIGLNDDVLVVGTGPIGLMALQLARSRGARRIYAAQRAGATKRLALARELGADEIILTDEVRLKDTVFARGGVDRVLVTAPPGVIPEALGATNEGGVVAFIGSGSGEDSSITFDADEFRRRKLELRSSAVSRSRFPTCIDLIASGAVAVERLVSHTFGLEELPQAFRIMRDDRQNRVKLVMVKD